MNPIHNTVEFKRAAIKKLVSTHRIDEVEVWDDKDDNIEAMREGAGDVSFRGNSVSPRFMSPTENTKRHSSYIPGMEYRV